MSFGTLMIVGLILVIFGMLLGILTVVKTIKRDIQIFFFRQKLPGIDANTEKSGKNIGRVAFGIIIVGFLLAVPSYILTHFMGNDSIFSENIEGAFIGDNQTQQKETDVRDVESTGLEEGDIIVIEGKTILFDGSSWEGNSIEEFGLYLETIEKTRVLSLRDDYAVSTVYHKAEKLLKEHGIAYGYGTAKGME